MNTTIYLNFAKFILKCCGVDERAAYLANIPAIISRTKTHDDLFNHTLFHIPNMVEITGNVFSTVGKEKNNPNPASKYLEPVMGRLKQDLNNSSNSMESYHYKKQLFFYNQILNDYQAIETQYLKFAAPTTLPDPEFFEENRQALFLAFLSHIYFDLWVTPRQLFFPDSATCSGSWRFWEGIDYFRLTEWMCYPREGDDPFLKIYGSSMPDEKLEALALIKAMIIRMGERGSPPVEYRTVDWSIRAFLRYLGAGGYKRVDTELEFLQKYEADTQSVLKEKFQE